MISLFLVNRDGLALEEAIENLGKKLNTIASTLTNKIPPSTEIPMGIKLPSGDILQLPLDSVVELTPEGKLIEPSTGAITIEISSPGGILKGVPYNASVQLPDGKIIKAPTSGNIKISTGGTVKIFLKT